MGLMDPKQLRERRKHLVGLHEEASVRYYKDSIVDRRTRWSANLRFNDACFKGRVLVLSAAV